MVLFVDDLPFLVEVVDLVLAYDLPFLVEVVDLV
jgi:PII-like signaling protein